MSREYCDYVLDLLSPLRGVSARRMFGGFGLFKSGLMFAIIVDDTLYFKTNSGNRADFETAGAEPFRYTAKSKTVTLSYWNVPAEVLDDEERFLDWAGKACRAARETKDATGRKKPITRKNPSKTKQ